MLSASIAKGVEIFDPMIKVEPSNLDHQVQKGRLLNIEGLIYDDRRRNDLA